MPAPQKKEDSITSRSNQSLLAKLRTGHYVELNAYRARIRPNEATPDCDLCDTGEAHDLQHWLQRCPSTARQRHYLFGSDSGRLDVLTSHPAKSFSLARSTLGDV